MYNGICINTTRKYLFLLLV